MLRAMGNSKGIVKILNIGTIDAAKYPNIGYKFNDYRKDNYNRNIIMNNQVEYTLTSGKDRLFIFCNRM